MRTARLALAAALLLPAAGCIVYERHGGPHGHDAPVVEEHAYVFFPAFSAYHCTVHDDWWAIDGGVWVRHASRPAFITLSAEVAWVDIDDHGPEPFVHFDDHCRMYPKDWKPGRGQGPPPGRGWRK